MILTFGQYSTLVAARHRVTRETLAQQTTFNDLLVSYYVAGLLATGLLIAVSKGDNPGYELTEAGRLCLVDYERNNPELSIKKTLSAYSLD